MADVTKEFLIRVRADIEKAVRDMERLTDEMKGQAKAARVENTRVSGLSRTFKRLTAAAGAYFTVQSAFKALRMADEYRVLQGQIQIATAKTGDYAQVSKELFQISQSNGAALKETVQLFRGVGRSAQDLGATQKDVLSVVEAIQQLSVLSGAGGARLSGAMLQLSQLFSGTVVQAQEFNSLIDATPELVQAIADGTGRTRSELIQAVKTGKVLVKEVFTAILKQAPAIAERMSAVPLSMARSTTRLENAFGQFLGELDQAVGATDTISNTFNFISAVLQDQSTSLNEYNSTTAQAVRLEERRLDLQTRIAKLQADIARQSSYEKASTATARLLRANRTGLAVLEGQLSGVNDELKTLSDQKAAEIKADIDVQGDAGADRIQGSAQSQQQLSDALADVNTRLEKQTELFKAQAKEAEAAQQRVGDLSASFRRAESELGAVETRAADATGLDIQQRVGQARQALAAGDLEGAVAGAEAARDLVLEVGKAGNESGFVLRFLLDQAKNIGVQAAQALADQQTGALDAVRNTLLDLQAQAKELQLIKVGFDQEAATLQAATLRANLQAQFAENPLVIPVVLQSAVNQGTDQPEPGERIASFARGGIVRGPGTGTSDSILAWLSDQEGVVNARAMRHYGGKRALDQINTLSLPRFAQGGVADLSSRILASSGAGGGSRPVNLFLNGERFEVSASDDVVQRMVRGFSKQALKRGSRA